MSREQRAAVSVLVDIPLARAWANLADFSLAHNYVPGLTRTEIVSEQSSGVGAHRRVYKGASYLEETISEWREGQGFSIALHKGDKPMPPFRRAEFVYDLYARGEQTMVELSLGFVMPLGGLGRILGRGVMLPAINKQLVGVAAGMKHFYETGTPASNEDRKRLAGSVEIAPAST